MKKLFALFLVAAMVAVPASQAREVGGLIGGCVGCCFGIRTAAAYNDGKDISIREWIRIIPIASIVGAVLDTVDGYNGIKTADIRAKYGEAYY